MSLGKHEQKKEGVPRKRKEEEEGDMRKRANRTLSGCGSATKRRCWWPDERAREENYRQRVGDSLGRPRAK